MKFIMVKIAVLAFSVLVSVCEASSQEAPVAQQGGEQMMYSVETTPVSTLFNVPETRAILEKYMPKLLTHSAMKMNSVQRMSLRQVKKFDDEGIITDETLAETEAALKAL